MTRSMIGLLNAFQPFAYGATLLNTLKTRYYSKQNVSCDYYHDNWYATNKCNDPANAYQQTVLAQSWLRMKQRSASTADFANSWSRVQTIMLYKGVESFSLRYVYLSSVSWLQTIFTTRCHFDWFILQLEKISMFHCISHYISSTTYSISPILDNGFQLCTLLRNGLFK